MDREKRKELYKLLKNWTRAEVLARVGPAGWPEFGQHAYREMELRDEIRKLLYGSDSLVEVGLKFGWLKSRDESADKKRRCIRGGKKTEEKHNKTKEACSEKVRNRNGRHGKGKKTLSLQKGLRRSKARHR